MKLFYNVNSSLYTKQFCQAYLQQESLDYIKRS